MHHSLTHNFPHPRCSNIKKMARMAVMRMNALGATSFVWEQWVSQPVREALNATAEQTIVLTINKHSPQVTVLSQIPQIVSKVTYSRSRLVPRPLLTSLLAHLPPPPPLQLAWIQRSAYFPQTIVTNVLLQLPPSFLHLTPPAPLLPPHLPPSFTSPLQPLCYLSTSLLLSPVKQKNANTRRGLTESAASC